MPGFCRPSHILFYLDEDLPNTSLPLFQGKVFANTFPRPIIALYGNRTVEGRMNIQYVSINTIINI